tara:strand:+ start:91 stop:345 length:255 start_codon:yes stop_codon:yes gene_type:complete
MITKNMVPFKEIIRLHSAMSHDVFLNKLADNLTKICSELNIKLLEVEDAANLSEAGKRRKQGNLKHGGIQGAGEYYKNRETTSI